MKMNYTTKMGFEECLSYPTYYQFNTIDHLGSRYKDNLKRAVKNRIRKILKENIVSNGLMQNRNITKKLKEKNANDSKNSDSESTSPTNGMRHGVRKGSVYSRFAGSKLTRRFFSPQPVENPAINTRGVNRELSRQDPRESPQKVDRRALELNHTRKSLIGTASSLLKILEIWSLLGFLILGLMRVFLIFAYQIVS